MHTKDNAWREQYVHDHVGYSMNSDSHEWEYHMHLQAAAIAWVLTDTLSKKSLAMAGRCDCVIRRFWLLFQGTALL